MTVKDFLNGKSALFSRGCGSAGTAQQSVPSMKEVGTTSALWSEGRAITSEAGTAPSFWSMRRRKHAIACKDQVLFRHLVRGLVSHRCCFDTCGVLDWTVVSTVQARELWTVVSTVQCECVLHRCFDGGVL